MTRITQALFEPLVIPFQTPIDTATRRWTERKLALVRLVADDGTEGYGEMATADGPSVARDGGGLGTAGLDGLDVADEASVDAAVETIGRTWPSFAAGVDAAAWDLRARSLGRSLAAVLGAQAGEGVLLNGIVGSGPPSSAAAEALTQVEAGLGCLKIKAGAEPIEAVVERVSAVRTAVGHDIALRVDLNGSLERAGAIDALARLAEYGLDYVEDPLLMATGADVIAEVRRQAPVAIAADEMLTGPGAAERIVRAGAVDVLVVKPARVGGITGARRIIEMARRAGVRVVLSTLFETGIGLAGALHLAMLWGDDDEAHGLATAHLLASDLLERPLPIVGGRMIAPGGPGLGVTLDAAAVSRFARR